MKSSDVIYGNNMDSIYQELCSRIINIGQTVGNTKELLNVSFELSNIDNAFVTVRDTSVEYVLGELLWYGASDNSVEFISAYGKMWERLSDDGVTNNSAYGYIATKKFGFDQVDQVIKQLKKDPNSRRAKININVPNVNSIMTNDEPCTLTIQFVIRDGKLNCTAMMRSNDVWFGLPYDVMFFTTLQKLIARSLNIDVGTYFHFVTSMHMYDRNIDDIKAAIDAPHREYRLHGLVDLLTPNRIHPVLKAMSKEDRRKNTERICARYGIGVILK